MPFTHLLTAEARNFLADHAHADPAKLALQAARFPGLPFRDLVAQLAARQRVRDKLPTWVANPAVIFPPTLSLEQSSSERTARYKAGLVAGETLADLTGGLGVDAWAFAERIPGVFYVEQNSDLADLAAHNLPALGRPNARVFAETAENFLPKNGPFDWVYLDPARRNETQNRVFKLDDCTPDVLALRPRLLEKAPNVLLKAAPLLDLDAAFRQLELVRSAHVVAVDNEVKELLFVLSREATPEPEIRAVNLLRNGTDQTLAFRRSDEAGASVAFSPPRRFLYEPNAALLKAGAFRLLAGRFGLQKLHPNSHLYTSDGLRADFPGRIFAVSASVKPDRRALRAVLPEGRANLTVRNFPATVETLRKQLGLADGGDDYVFATSNPDGKPVLVVARKA
jgi:16S rRNA G966 N2-methylase RsmD